MRAYAVMSWVNGACMDHREYLSLEAAQQFIKTRVPKPQQIGKMLYQDSEGGEYSIHDMLISDGDEEKIFWRVCQKYFDNGKVFVEVSVEKAAKKPENTKVEGKTFDEHNDYFEDRQEADEWADKALKA